MPVIVSLETPIQDHHHYKILRSQLTDRFMKFKINGEFVDRASLNITLAHLGHVSEKSLEKLSVLKSFASFYPKQDVILNGIIAAPTWVAARTMWMSCRKTDSLVNLQEMILKCIQREGIGAEMKNFFPRINICRFPTETNLKELFYGIPSMYTVTEIEATNIVVYDIDILKPDKMNRILSFPLQ